MPLRSLFLGGLADRLRSSSARTQFADKLEYLLETEVAGWPSGLRKD